MTDAFFKLGLKGCSLGIQAYTKDTVHLVLQKAKSLVWCWTTSVFKERIDYDTHSHQRPHRVTFF